MDSSLTQASTQGQVSPAAILAAVTQGQVSPAAILAAVRCATDEIIVAVSITAAAAKCITVVACITAVTRTAAAAGATGVAVNLIDGVTELVWYVWRGRHFWG